MFKLTTIVPVYDGEFIDECLQSMTVEFDKKPELSKFFDIVIVSDGCDKNILDKLSSYESKYKNISLVKSEHRGASHARNLGIKNASGEYITFLDSDDRMCSNFFSDCLSSFEKDADLYIFGIKRFEDDIIKYWQVNDKIYNSNNKFADEYIVNRHLLVYSNTNKFYKAEIIRKHNLCFDENIEFGEDRLFNFDYLRLCNTIITSSIYKIDYVKRKDESLSTKYQKDYFNIAVKIHKEKIKVFLDLSKKASEEEKKDFTAYDIGHEFEKAINRFDYNDKEINESVPCMNKFIFEDCDDKTNDIGIFLILGSNNCEYRVEKAYELAKDKPFIKFIVSGGNEHKSGNISEADFMAKYLIDKGVASENIFIEKDSINTIQNLSKSKEIIDNLLNSKIDHKGIGIVTAGFHVKRTKKLSDQIFNSEAYNVHLFPAYTERTAPDSWYKTKEGTDIILNELKKIVIYNFDEYMRFVYNDE